MDMIEDLILAGADRKKAYQLTEDALESALSERDHRGDVAAVRKVNALYMQGEVVHVPRPMPPSPRPPLPEHVTPGPAASAQSAEVSSLQLDPPAANEEFGGAVLAIRYEEHDGGHIVASLDVELC